MKFKRKSLVCSYVLTEAYLMFYIWYISTYTATSGFNFQPSPSKHLNQFWAAQSDIV